MKKLLALALVVLMIVPFAAACKKTKGGVAMITDYGDITDQSFNQTTHEACEKFCKENNINYKYFKPATASTQDRVAQIKAAINEGYDVIVLPGYAFGEAIYEVQDLDECKDVKFVALDVSQFDVEDCFYNHKKDAEGNDVRDGLKDENNQPHLNKNVYCAVYQEELCGYMAGYAAVKLGYKHLGFLGGKAVPAVIRYGFGFVQGCDAAAKELGIENDVVVEYVYGNVFGPDDKVKGRMDTWFQNGTEVVFACGGAIYESAVAAAKDANAKIIGVDVDQKGIIDGIGGAGMTVTSAMKGLAATVNNVLTETIKNNKWDELFGGKYESLGLVSGDDPTLNYVQIPMESTQWSDAFTQDNYKELVKKLFDKTIKVSDKTDNMPEVSITVNDQGTM